MPTSLLTKDDCAVFATVGAATQAPGTIVEDFDRLLEVLATDGIPLSAKHAQFALARLPALNAMLSKPAKIGLTRGQQISYPHIDGLHMLLRLTRLGKLDRSASVPRMVLDVGLAIQWRKLNPTERYFVLLEWWFRGAEFEHDRDEYKALQMAENRFELLELHRPGSKAHDAAAREQALLYFLGMKELALLQMFGMLDVSEGDPVPGKGWQISKMLATRWGLACCRSYKKAFRYTSEGRLEALLGLADDQLDEVDEAAADEQDADVPAFHRWADAVNPYFPAWKRGIG